MHYLLDKVVLGSSALGSLKIHYTLASKNAITFDSFLGEYTKKSKLNFPLMYLRLSTCNIKKITSSFPQLCWEIRRCSIKQTVLPYRLKEKQFSRFKPYLISRYSWTLLCYTIHIRVPLSPSWSKLFIKQNIFFVTGKSGIVWGLTTIRFSFVNFCRIYVFKRIFCIVVFDLSGASNLRGN